MNIPDYQTLMLPVLQFISDGKEYRFRDIVDGVAEMLSLTVAERKEMLASGSQTVLDSRVGWARTYLKKAGLLASPRRGVHIITELGERTLKEKPNRIDVKYLKQFPVFLDFINASNKNNNDGIIGTSSASEEITPEENLDKSYQIIREALSAELLSKVVELSPTTFERLVVELLVKMGYGGSIKDAGKAVGKSGDEGIDGTIKEDRLGLDIIYIQAKRWKPGNVVGRPELQKFVGALAGQGAKKGIFITTSSFTKEALEYTPKNETKIVLIDGYKLTELMIDFNLGCSVQQVYELKRVDLDYFEQG